MKFIKFVSNGKTKLLIYAENDTYIESYENGKIVRTYIIESDVTEKIKNIIKNGNWLYEFKKTSYKANFRYIIIIIRRILNKEILWY